tara:strand:+ start:37 stop:642 length:606 start_codon:yes stop_codon:yes gene_type:complete
MDETNINDTKEVIEEETSNTSIKNENEEYDKMSIKDFITKEKVLEEKRIKEEKVDKRKISSRINIAKARAAKLRKAAERKKQLASLFGDDSEESESESSESESSEEDYRDKYHNHKYKTLFNKQKKEMDDMRQLIFKLAKKQKKYSRRGRKQKSRSPSPKKQQPQPVIHYNIEAPQFKKEEVKPKEVNSVFTNYLKNKLSK